MSKAIPLPPMSLDVLPPDSTLNRDAARAYAKEYALRYGRLVAEACRQRCTQQASEYTSAYSVDACFKCAAACRQLGEGIGR